jgi:hypothetical protein
VKDTDAAVGKEAGKPLRLTHSHLDGLLRHMIRFSMREQSFAAQMRSAFERFGALPPNAGSSAAEVFDRSLVLLPSDDDSRRQRTHFSSADSNG